MLSDHAVYDGHVVEEYLLNYTWKGVFVSQENNYQPLFPIPDIVT